jgi:hypothetical protein
MHAGKLFPAGPMRSRMKMPAFSLLPPAKLQPALQAQGVGCEHLSVKQGLR